jgi:NAD(P)-dependent dehydrogenase (short-subunit alcohol dehydrogenase family)
MQKTWFITGASRGFGRIWAEAALKRGDRVTATARKLADVADLAERFGDTVLPLALDVTDSVQVQQAIHQAYAHFDRLDVLVNNAGVSLFAATEEASDEQVRGVFDANYFGMVRVIRAALPLLRKQGNGDILGVSSGLGIAALPLIGFYSATKWAVEIFHASRAIDSLLKHMVEHEAVKVGRALTGYLNLKRSLNNIQRHGVGGQKFTPATVTDVTDLTKARNRYLHVADDFPADRDLRVFLNQTVRAIGEAITFPA